MDLSSRGVKKWRPHSFDQQILAYARKYNIALKGLLNLGELVQEIEEEEGELPELVHSTSKSDVFHYERELTRYKERYGSVPHFMSIHGRKQKTKLKTNMGGDNLDITSWTSAERKAAHFDKKDPLGKKELDMIKEECVVSGLDGFAFQVLVLGVDLELCITTSLPGWGIMCPAR